MFSVVWGFFLMYFQYVIYTDELDAIYMQDELENISHSGKSIISPIILLGKKKSLFAFHSYL